jgi:Fe-S-cluster-containing hydrogenase component 2
MIGCPVTAIVKGEQGQMQIKNWCIGCQLCADQCPYGSIHMYPLTAGERRLWEARANEARNRQQELKEVTLRATVCDQCAGSPEIAPACVYHCPHDAALRVDAQSSFPLE